MATSYNPYYSGGWQSGEEGGTPITPDALNHMDDGIAGAYDYIQRSTANKAKFIFFNVASWADIYSKVSVLAGGETATMYISTSVVSFITDGAVSSRGLAGFIAPTNTSAGRYILYATHYECDFSCMWEINGLTSASATPTVLNFKKIAPEYHVGDTYSTNFGQFPFRTLNDKSALYFRITLPKPFGTDVSGFDVTISANSPTWFSSGSAGTIQAGTQAITKDKSGNNEISFTITTPQTPLANAGFGICELNATITFT